MADGPSVRRIKSEKRNLPVEPAPSGMSRRRFLTFLGTGSAALAAGSAGVLTGCAESEEQGSANRESQNGQPTRTGGQAGGSPRLLLFGGVLPRRALSPLALGAAGQEPRAARCQRRRARAEEGEEPPPAHPGGRRLYLEVAFPFFDPLNARFIRHVV